jgi:hypothetical protein
MSLTAAVTFAVVYAALHAAHQVGDHWVQLHGQAVNKGRPGWTGRFHCAAHVASYLVTCFLFIAVAALVLGLDLDLVGPGMGLGMAVNGLTHYIADRRTPLMWMARRTGHGEFIDTCGPEAAYKLDQSWHTAWLFASALIIAAL